MKGKVQTQLQWFEWDVFLDLRPSETIAQTAALHVQPLSADYLLQLLALLPCFLPGLASPPPQAHIQQERFMKYGAQCEHLVKAVSAVGSWRGQCQDF